MPESLSTEFRQPIVVEYARPARFDVGSLLRLCLGAAGLFALVVYAVGGNKLEWFINFPAAAMVLGGAAMVMIMTHPLADFGRAVRAGISPWSLLPSERATAMARYWDHASASLIALGGLSMLVGMIVIVSNMSDPSQIGPGMAVALIGPIYAIIASECFCQVLRRRIIAGQPADMGTRSDGMNRVMMLCLLALFSVVSFGVTWLSLPPHP